MENKRPFKQTSDKVKDMYKNYVKNDKNEREIDIKSEDDVEEELKEKDNNEEAEAKESAESEEKNEMPEGLSDSEKLEFQLDDLEKQNESLKDQILRKTAEMENLRRRTKKEREDFIQYANADLLKNMLDIPDDINNALEAAEKTSDNEEALKDGIKMIHNKVFKIFESAGVKKMTDLEGAEFDVDYHEALMQQPSEEIPEGHIISVVQSGYMYGDKVLRHAKVITSSGKE